MTYEKAERHTKTELYEAFCIEHSARKILERENKRVRAMLSAEQHTNKIKRFLLKNFHTDIDTVDRCLNKATTIVYDNDMVCVMDNEWIYYFGTIEKNRLTRKFYRFYKLFDLKGKKLAPINAKMYKNHLKMEEKHYIWI